MLNSHLYGRDRLERPFPDKLVGEDYEAVLADQRNGSGSYHVKNEAGPRAATCNSQGLAAGYPCQNVDLLSMLDVDELAAALGESSEDELNDIWGWTDPSSKREFSIVGMYRGTAFVEITDAYNPIYLGALPTKTESSGWRDIKVMANYALIVSEASNHGMQIFDLDRLLTASGSTVWSEDAHYDEFGNAHNIFVNEDSGFAYAVGSNTCAGGLHIIDVNDPMNPTFAGCFAEDGYVHDVQCVIYNGPDTTYSGREICFSSNEDSVAIVDVSVKSDPQILSNIQYNSAQYTHQGWLTEDQAYFIFDDELDEYYGISSKTRTHVMDVRNLRNMLYVGYHNGRTRAIDHNLYVKGDFVYQANYRAGLNVLKIEDMTSATFDEAGYFDIFPNSNSANFNAAWSTFPYHESGVITISGVEQGLFVVKFNSQEETTHPSSAPTSTPSMSPVVVSTPAPSKAPTSTCFSCCEEVKSQMNTMEDMLMTILDLMTQVSTPAPISPPTAAPVTSCVDTVGKVVHNGSNRNWCQIARNANNTNKSCRNNDLYDLCPVTCGRCSP